MPSSLTEGIKRKVDRLANRTNLTSGSVLTAESGSRVILTPQALPATCTPGELVVDSGAGNDLKICTAADTWVVVGTQT